MVLNWYNYSVDSSALATHRAAQRSEARRLWKRPLTCFSKVNMKNTDNDLKVWQTSPAADRSGGQPVSRCTGFWGRPCRQLLSSPTAIWIHSWLLNSGRYCILALRLILSQLYRKFSKRLHVAYVDTKAAFDSVDREALWKALQAKHVPPFLISLIKDLHTGTKSCVRVSRSCTALFPTSSGVRQGCVLAPALFRIAIDWIMSICADKAGVNVGQSLFTDIDYADDAVMFAEGDA